MLLLSHRFATPLRGLFFATRCHSPLLDLGHEVSVHLLLVLDLVALVADKYGLSDVLALALVESEGGGAAVNTDILGVTDPSCVAPVGLEAGI